MADLDISIRGTVAMITPQTIEGRQWVGENLECEDWQWHGESLAVEPRSLLVIIESATEDGLEISQ